MWRKNLTIIPKNNFLLLSFGGIFYGYNTGDIGAILLTLEKNSLGSITDHAFLMGAFFAGLASSLFLMSILINKIGRKRTLFLGAWLMLFASSSMLFTTSIHTWIILRLLLGAAVGFLNSTIPVYLTEHSRLTERGKSGVLFQFFIVFGLFFSTGLSFLLSNSIEEKASFFVEAMLALMFVLILYTQFREVPHRTPTYHLINPFKICFKKSVRFPFMIALLVVSLNQLSGINVFIQHDAYLLHYLDTSSRDEALLGSTQITLFNLLSTVLVFFIADKFERRLWLRFSLWGISFVLLLMGLFSMGVLHFNNHTPLFTLFLLVYVILFALGPGALVWTVITEILPAEIRATATPLVLSDSAFVAAIFSGIFLPLEKMIGFAPVFFICALFMLAYSALTFFMPNTRNISLEDIRK